MGHVHWWARHTRCRDMDFQVERSGLDLGCVACPVISRFKNKKTEDILLSNLRKSLHGCKMWEDSIKVKQLTERIFIFFTAALSEGSQIAKKHRKHFLTPSVTREEIRPKLVMGFPAAEMDNLKVLQDKEGWRGGVAEALKDCGAEGTLAQFFRKKAARASTTAVHTLWGSKASRLES